MNLARLLAPAAAAALLALALVTGTPMPLTTAHAAAAPAAPKPPLPGFAATAAGPCQEGRPGAAPTALLGAPRSLGRHHIPYGKSKELGELRLWMGSDFVPERVGSDKGAVEAYLRGAILPSYERDGIKPENYNHAWLSPATNYPQRLGVYRWRATATDLRLTGSVEVTVEQLPCAASRLEAPLVPGESRTLWLSTRGESHLIFDRDRWKYGDRLELNLTAGPDSKPGVWYVDLTYVRPARLGTKGKTVSGNLALLDPAGVKRATAGDHEVELVHATPASGVAAAGLRLTGPAPFLDIHALVRITRR